ncbi:MAG: efflux RND transporter periplasmic adaptor subunit [Acidobacteriota bacterium]
MKCANRMGGVVAAVAGLILSGLAVLTGCDRPRQVVAATEEASAEPTVPAEPAGRLPRFVEATGGKPIDPTLELQSHLMVEQNVGVTARRDGIIEAIHVDRGDQVEEDQRMATLERGDLLLAEKTAQLALEKESSSFNRIEKLYAQRVLSEEEFEQARLRRDAAEKALEKVRYELSKCVIRAPFAGVVSGRFVEKGQFIRADDRKTLFQVTALRPLLARIYVPEWALFGIRPGESARIVPTAAPMGSLPRSAGGIAARVKWINHVVDAASGSAEALVEVLETPAARRLRPGMSVAVGLKLTFAGDPTGTPLVSLPREVIALDDPEPGDTVALRILANDGSVVTRSVVLGLVGDARVEARRGLSEGEKVVLP